MEGLSLAEICILAEQTVIVASKYHFLFSLYQLDFSDD